MNALPLLRSTSILAVSILFTLTARVAAQQPTTGSKAGFLTHVVATPTPLETLQQRVTELEQAVAALKGAGTPTGSRLEPLKRLQRDTKADAPAVTKHDIDVLWNQVDQIIQRLNELAAGR